MGMYAWLSEQDFEKYSHVTDKELDEILQDVRSLLPRVYVGERIETIHKMIGKNEYITRYDIYTKCKDDYNEVHCMNLKSSDKHYVANYLFGLMNGYRACLVEQLNKQNVDETKDL